MANQNIGFFFIDMLSAFFALCVAIFLSKVLSRIYKLVKPKKGAQIQSQDRKMLYVIILLIASMFFKIIEKVLKAFARLY